MKHLKILPMTLWGLLLIARCGNSPTDTSLDNLFAIELETFINEDFGLSGLAPKGWHQYPSGQFTSDLRPAGKVELITEFFPAMNKDWLAEMRILPVLGVGALPNSIGNIETDSFSWNLYTIPVQLPGAPRVADLAVAESSEGVYRVMLTAGEDDRAVIYDTVFLSAVNALKPIDTTDPSISYEEGIRLFDYDPQSPLDLIFEDSIHVDNFASITINYASPKGGRVPATIMVPDGPGPFAGLTVMHGLPSRRQNMFSVGEYWAKAGAVVILIDAPFARPENQNRSAITLTNKDREEQIQLIVDLRRSVDILIARPDVDAARLAYLGVSYGGAMGGLLAGVEDRLKAYVLMVGDGGLVEHLTGFEDQGGVSQSWREAMWAIEPLHYIGHATPAILLFQSGLNDLLVPYADAVRYQSAASQPKKIMWYDAGHSLNTEAFQDQVRWLQPYLGLNTAVP